SSATRSPATSSPPTLATPARPDLAHRRRPRGPARVCPSPHALPACRSTRPATCARRTRRRRARPAPPAPGLHPRVDPTSCADRALVGVEVEVDRRHCAGALVGVDLRLDRTCCADRALVGLDRR